MAKSSNLTGINNCVCKKDPDLFYAAEKGDLKQVKHLVSLGYPINQTNTIGKTALIIAADKGRAEVVEYLCQQGANISHVDFGGSSALDCAKQYDVQKEKRRKVVGILERFLTKHQKSA